MADVYIESPLDRIVDVHFAEPEPPDDGDMNPFVGFFSTGGLTFTTPSPPQRFQFESNFVPFAQAGQTGTLTFGPTSNYAQRAFSGVLLSFTVRVVIMAVLPANLSSGAGTEIMSLVITVDQPAETAIPAPAISISYTAPVGSFIVPELEYVSVDNTGFVPPAGIGSVGGQFTIT